LVVVPPSDAPPARRRDPGDALALRALALPFLLLTFLTWKKWGNPSLDAGA